MPESESPIADAPGSRVPTQPPFLPSAGRRDSEPYAAREGLPPGYRMRADPHYVELLTARPAAERFEPGLPPEPSSPEDAASHAGADLARSLETLCACVGVLGAAPTELSRLTVGRLVAAESWRASCVLAATRMLRRELPVTKSSVSAAGILQRAVHGFAAERQLRGIEVLEQIEPAAAALAMSGSERLLVNAVSGALFATVALFDDGPGARVVLGASVQDDCLAFSVSQRSVPASAAWTTRAFDATWTERPGGVPAMVLLRATEQIAAAHGGRAIAARANGGTSITIELPRL